MKPSVSQRVRIECPPQLFDQLTDILAELVLEDLRQFPMVATLKGIDTVSSVDNTPALISRGAP